MTLPASDPRGSDGKRAARVAFALTFAVFVIGTPLSWWPGHEPYPALVMPAFPLYKGAVVRTAADATVSFRDGQTASVALDRLLPPTPLESTVVAARTFNNDEWTRDPRIVAWLRERLERQFPGRSVTAIDITWDLTASGDPSFTTEQVRTTHVEFS